MKNIIYHESTKTRKNKEIKKIVLLRFHVFGVDFIPERDFKLCQSQMQVLSEQRRSPS